MEEFTKFTTALYAIQRKHAFIKRVAKSSSSNRHCNLDPVIALSYENSHALTRRLW